MALNTYHCFLERALKTELIQPPDPAQCSGSVFTFHKPFLNCNLTTSSQLWKSEYSPSILSHGNCMIWNRSWEVRSAVTEPEIKTPAVTAWRLQRGAGQRRRTRRQRQRHRQLGFPIPRPASFGRQHPSASWDYKRNDPTSLPRLSVSHTRS